MEQTAPNPASLRRDTAKGHGLAPLGGRAWVADTIGTVRSGEVYRMSSGAYAFRPDDPRVAPFAIGGPLVKYYARKIEQEG